MYEIQSELKLTLKIDGVKVESDQSPQTIQLEIDEPCHINISKDKMMIKKYPQEQPQEPKSYSGGWFDILRKKGAEPVETGDVTFPYERTIYSKVKIPERKAEPEEAEANIHGVPYDNSFLNMVKENSKSVFRVNDPIRQNSTTNQFVQPLEDREEKGPKYMSFGEAYSGCFEKGSNVSNMSDESDSLDPLVYMRNRKYLRSKLARGDIESIGRKREEMDTELIEICKKRYSKHLETEEEPNVSIVSFPFEISSEQQGELKEEEILGSVVVPSENGMSHEEIFGCPAGPTASEKREKNKAKMEELLKERDAMELEIDCSKFKDLIQQRIENEQIHEIV